MISRRIFTFLALLTWTWSVYGACDAGLSTQVADVNLQQESALAALLHFGSENGICLAVEGPGLDLLRGGVRIQASHPTVAYVIQTLLNGGSYQFSENHGVIYIRNAGAMPQMTQLDTVVPEYTIPRMSIARAMLGLFIRLERLADPSLGNMGIHYSDPYPDDQVGPMDEHGRTARELLTLIVSQSPGSAWVSGQCLGPVTASQGPCWTVLSYRDLPKNAAIVENLVGKLTVERISAK